MSVLSVNTYKWDPEEVFKGNKMRNYAPFYYLYTDFIWKFNQNTWTLCGHYFFFGSHRSCRLQNKDKAKGENMNFNVCRAFCLHSCDIQWLRSHSSSNYVFTLSFVFVTHIFLFHICCCCKKCVSYSAKYEKMHISRF